MLLIKRATYNGNHSGQIAFPGGKKETFDASNWETAIRETEEEVGVLAKKINLLKKLTPVYVTVSNYKVFPFIGTIDYTPKFILQKDEVADVLKIPFSDFLALKTKLVTVSDPKNKEFVVPAFVFQSHVIWGATAMMLNELKMLFIEAME